MVTITKQCKGTETVSNTGICEILIESAADLPDIPEICKPGSVAYTASLEDMWIKGNDGIWAKIGGES